MPSLMQTMAATQVFATEKRNAKIKPSLIVVDNVNALEDAVITVVDRFTPAITNGNPAPGMGVQTPVRLQINVSLNACVSLQDELKDVEILGQLEVTRAPVSALCFVSTAWNYS